MTFPIWDLELGGGLLIAIVAVTHVFVSHFAVGGGLFLVITEKRAHRMGDEALLGWLKRHAKFFALLTLVFGAVTGVGIWFTIGLVHPTATAMLIRLFVWVWAIEWVFFFIEIAAAIIYATTFDTLSRKAHVAIGWIYFGAAFMSLVVINGILTFMFTPGAWPQTASLWDAFFNPSYLPSLLIRTLGAVAFAGLYVFITAWREEPDLRVRLSRWAAWWVLPATLVGPAAAYFYFVVGGESAWEAARGAVPNAALGFHLAVGSAIGFAAILTAVLLLVRRYPRIVALPTGILLLLCGFGSIGGGELIREGARKPYIIGNPEDGGPMYVNSIAPRDVARFQKDGLLATAQWANKTPGEDLFRIACRGCHTVNGYNAIASLVHDKSIATLLGTIGTLEKRRGRMPPFPGSEEEKLLLARFLAGLDGEVGEEPVRVAEGPKDDRGGALVEEHCLSCHSLDAEDDDPPALLSRIEGWTAEEAYDTLGKLGELSDEMFDFDGSDEERRILADHLAKLAGGEQ